MKNIVFRIELILIVCCMISCTEVHESPYLVPSISSYTFKSDGNESIGIYIRSNIDWEVSADREWIELRQEKDTVWVTVTDNESVDDRFGSISFTSREDICSVGIMQLGNGFKGYFEELPNNDAAMSRNGRFILVVDVAEVDGAYEMYPVVLDTDTGDRVKYEDAQCQDPIAISDDGKSFVVANSGNLQLVYVLNGNAISLQLPEGFMSPFIEDISGDGSVAVGYAMDQNYKYVPVKWINGEPELLKVPDMNCANLPLRTGVMARGCSDDGDVVYGSEWDTQGVVYWKGSEMFYPGLDNATIKKMVVNHPLFGEYETEYVSTVKISAGNMRSFDNCSTLAALFDDVKKEGGDKIVSYAACVNLESGTIKVCDGFEGFQGMTTDDEGHLFAASPASGVRNGYVFDMETDEMLTVSDWFKKEKGITMSDNRIVTGVSNGVYMGWRYEPTPSGTDAYYVWYMKMER